jgi:hypothetical protein
MEEPHDEPRTPEPWTGFAAATRFGALYERLVTDPEVAALALQARLISDGLTDLQQDEHFWAAYDYIRESDPDVSGIVAEDGFLAFEYHTLSAHGAGPQMSELASSALLRQVGPMYWIAARHPVPPSPEVREHVAELNSELRGDADESVVSGQSDPDGRFGRALRRIGRGLLVVGGAALAGADAAVFVGTAGVAGAPAVASMAVGMTSIAVGTYNRPDLFDRRSDGKVHDEAGTATINGVKMPKRYQG